MESRIGVTDNPVNPVRALARRVLSRDTRRRLTNLLVWPPVGTVRFGSLRRLSPVSRDWGFDRGQPIDRYYIERFLTTHAADIRGRVLEIDNNNYTSAFGGDRVTQSDVLHISDWKPGVTMVGDLTKLDNVDSELFDCVIVTQTLQFIFDCRAALRTIHRILRPGGVALVTVPAINKSRDEKGAFGDYWAFRTLSAQRLFEELFPAEQVTVTGYGNVLAAVSFLHGLAAGELTSEELDQADRAYELLVGVRARKPEE
ncbi:MAG TPA: methyltransferase domain-containing protein [Gemmatimonadales bacterium]|jgi:SAM-dependent methyltransferase|nr:methyltransferase domain-containing protein [Gemmatimonadales bacterium]